MLGNKDFLKDWLGALFSKIYFNLFILIVHLLKTHKAKTRFFDLLHFCKSFHRSQSFCTCSEGVNNFVFTQNKPIAVQSDDVYQTDGTDTDYDGASILSDLSNVALELLDENLNDFDHEEDPVLNDNENLNDFNHKEVCDVHYSYF